MFVKKSDDPGLSKYHQGQRVSWNYGNNKVTGVVKRVFLHKVYSGSEQLGWAVEMELDESSRKPVWPDTELLSLLVILPQWSNRLKAI